MNKMALLMIVGMFGILSGCATTPTIPSNAQQAPNERILAFQQKTPKTTATLIVTRDSGFLGGGCYYSLAINSILAARLDVGETARFYLEPGEILLRVGRDPQGKGLCSVGQEHWTQRETILRSDEIKYFRLMLDANGAADIQRSEP